jgi:Tfp pilus assembly major pilin PilA
MSGWIWAFCIVALAGVVVALVWLVRHVQDERSQGSAWLDIFVVRWTWYLAGGLLIGAGCAAAFIWSAGAEGEWPNALGLSVLFLPITMPLTGFFTWLIPGLVKDFRSTGTATFNHGYQQRLLSIAVIGILATVAVPACSDYKDRVALKKALDDAAQVRARIGEYHTKEARLPIAAEAGAFKVDSDKRSIAYDAAMRMVVITMKERQEGKRFGWQANLEDKDVKWTCRAIDLEPKYLPRECETK